MDNPERWRHRFWPARSVDRFVVSFPKAGRTWLRVLLAVAEAHARNSPPDSVVREWLTHEAPTLHGKQVLFTHALSALPAEPDAAMGLFLGYIGDRRRLFLVRDPRDVLVSYYFHLAKRERRASKLGSLGDFVRDSSSGIDRILLFMRACGDSLRHDLGPALLLSYEELHRDAKGSLASALEFFGAPPLSADALRSAAEFGSFENMHRLELEGALTDPNKRLLAPDPSDPESFKTRRGEVGSYRDYLSDEEIGQIEERIAALLPPELGYREPGVPPELSVRALSALAPRLG